LCHFYELLSRINRHKVDSDSRESSVICIEYRSQDLNRLIETGWVVRLFLVVLLGQPWASPGYTQTTHSPEVILFITKAMWLAMWHTTGVCSITSFNRIYHCWYFVLTLLKNIRKNKRQYSEMLWGMEKFDVKA